MQLKSVRHTGLVVRDLEQSLHFYQDILGLTVWKRTLETGAFIEKVVGIPGVSLEWVKLKLPDDTMIELLQYHSHPDQKPFQTSKNAPFKIRSTHPLFGRLPFAFLGGSRWPSKLPVSTPSFFKKSSTPPSANRLPGAMTFFCARRVNPDVPKIRFAM